MRRRIVAGNWKMHKTPAEAVALAKALKEKIGTPGCDVVFCVPALSLLPVAEVLKDSPIALGAQNMHFADSGAYTGELSADMLLAAGVTYVIIGHSERREYFNETDETVNLKVKKALSAGLIPILCCGETLAQREMGITEEWVRIQLKLALQGVTAEDVQNVVVAYEPIWAIGTGKTATEAQAEEVCAAIRKLITELYGKDVAEAVRIQYGGSVNAVNCKALFAMDNIDGGLVGGASLKEEFAVLTEE